MAASSSADLCEDDDDDVPLALRCRVPRSTAPKRKMPNVASSKALQEWPGLPRGVQFNPSDDDLIWHLIAKTGRSEVLHPYIGEFIKSFDDKKCFDCVDPQDLPGLKQDGVASFFFHKISVSCNGRDGKHSSWVKIGNSKPVMLDGDVKGYKSTFSRHMGSSNDHIPSTSFWMMHRYHIFANVEDKSNTFVVSKLLCEFKVDEDKAALQHCCRRCNTVSLDTLNIQSDYQEKDLKYTCAHKNCTLGTQEIRKYSVDCVCPHRGGEYTGGMRCDIVTDGLEGDELDHLTLLERYRMISRESPSQRSLATAGPGVSVGTDNLIPGASVGQQQNFQLLFGDYLVNNSLDSIGSGISHNMIVRSPCSVITNCNLEIVGGPYGTYNSSISSHPVEEYKESLHGTNNICVPEQIKAIKDEECENASLFGASEISDTLSQVDPTVADTSIVDLSSRQMSTARVIFPRLLENSTSSNLREDAKVRSVMVNKPMGDSMVAEAGIFKQSESSLNRMPVSSERSATVKNETIDEDTPVQKLPTDHQALLRPYSWTSGGKLVNSNQLLSDSTDLQSNVSESSSLIRDSRRKRKKTATNSIQTALEEDAPGLLEILLNRGITVDEIKLFDDAENDELIESSAESNFENLETVVASLFKARTSNVKISLDRNSKDVKAIYCLACLISLVEQARYLQFWDNPVEWGWCRDLLSFIFIFRSHNRIVLERPEYGYATYFFEIVHSLPIDWQIRRLIIAMKLTNCCRTILMENKPLLVGEDLSEHEARVLEEYGWYRNTGLGTMLKYCDRVFHDRKIETINSEWRLKIGRLLMDGYEGGNAILSHLPKQASHIKIEDTGS